MTQPQSQPSKVSTVLTVVFGSLTGLICFAVLLGAIAAVFAGARGSPVLWLLTLLYAAAAASSLIGGIHLLTHREAGITMVTAGGILGLVIVLSELVVGALPQNAAMGPPTYLSWLLLFSVLALVQARRKKTRQWIAYKAQG